MVHLFLALGVNLEAFEGRSWPSLFGLSWELCFPRRLSLGLPRSSQRGQPQCLSGGVRGWGKGLGGKSVDITRMDGHGKSL